MDCVVTAELEGIGQICVRRRCLTERRCHKGRPEARSRSPCWCRLAVAPTVLLSPFTVAVYQFDTVVVWTGSHATFVAICLLVGGGCGAQRGRVSQWAVPMAALRRLGQGSLLDEGSPAWPRAADRAREDIRRLERHVRPVMRRRQIERGTAFTARHAPGASTRLVQWAQVPYQPAVIGVSQSALGEAADGIGRLLDDREPGRFRLLLLAASAVVRLDGATS